MTAEGTACNGAGEAPKAEFSPEKALAASPEDKDAGEREAEDVGGPFVIVNGGDSDGHSERGSDLGRAPDEDSPSEEDDVPAPNVAPDAAAGGDHVPAGGEPDAPGAATGASSADGGDRAADRSSEGGAGEGKADPSSEVGPEVAQQEAAGEEDTRSAALVSSETDPAAAGADPETPAIGSEVEGKEYTVDGGAVTDVAAAVVQEATNTEQDGADADAVFCGHDDALKSAKSSSESNKEEQNAANVVEAAANTEQDGEDSDEVSCGDDDILTPAKSGSNREERNAADVVEPVEQGTDGSSALAENGQFCADTRADSFVHATEPETQEDAVAESCRPDDALVCTDSSSATVESKVSTGDVVEVTDQGTCGADSLIENGHLCPNTQADSFEVAAEPDSHDNESKLEQSTIGVTELVERDATSGEQDGTDAAQTNGHVSVNLSGDSCILASASKVHAIEMKEQETDLQEEVPTIEAEVDGYEHNNVEGSADASGEQEVTFNQVEGETACGILRLEGVGKHDVSLCDDFPAGVVSSNEHIELHMEKEINEDVPGFVESEEVANNTSQNAQGDVTKYGVSIGTIHSVESSLENKANAKADTVIEITTETDFNAENGLRMKTVAREVEELIQQDCESALKAVDCEKSEGPAVEANGIANDVEIELKKEVIDAVPLQETAASTFHNEPTSDLVDCDNINSSSLDTSLESFDHVHTEHSRSREISKTTEHGTMVASEAEITLATGNGHKEKPSDIAADQGGQGGSVDLNVDEIVVIDDAQLSSTAGNESSGLENVTVIFKNDESSEIVGDSKSLVDSSRTGNEGSSLVNKVNLLIEESCLSDESCNTISSENLNASTKSSDLVETKHLGELEPSSIGAFVPAEQKDDNEHASGELPGDHAVVVGQQKFFIIKIPKFAGNDVFTKIQAAQAQLDRLTQERDAINRRKQKQKAVCDQYRERLEAARREEREARIAHGDKKNDLNSVRSVLGKLHQANSIEEIDELIVKKERIIQHETIDLKEEKLLLKEINDLKAQRKQLSSNIGSKAEINEAFDQKDHIHERHKALKKDSDVLFTNLKSLEENTRKIQKSFDNERIALRKLIEEYLAANERRQKAYNEWFDLKKEPSIKNRYFFMFKDDERNARNFRTSGDMYGLKLFCNNQIEEVMELWNKNEDFRRQYVESNKRSTLVRLGTHDGRKLGPNEDPPVIPSRRPHQPSHSNTSSLTASSPEVPTLTAIPAPTLTAPASAPTNVDSFPALPAPQISRHKSKASASSAQVEKSVVTVSEEDHAKQNEKEKARLVEEELELARMAEELARKEEELRKERAAAEKERLRLEQKAKAKEAEERKRRKAEKDKERAEFKARKEAEEREKKKAKKDKRKGTAPADSSITSDSNAAALATADTDSNASVNSREIEVPQPSAPKKLSRPAAAIKQLNRVQPMPAPLRNRGKRKMRQYILIAAAVLSVLALFVAGNYIPRLKSVHT